MLQEYRYEIGPEEYLAYQKYHMTHDKTIARRIFWMRLIISLALLLIGVLLDIIGQIGLIVVGAFAVLAVCAWMLVPQWMRDSMRKTAEKKYAPRIQPYTAVTTMEEDGLHIFDGEDTQVLLYDSIEQIGDEDGYLFLGYGDRQTVVIPPAAFTRGRANGRRSCPSCAIWYTSAEQECWKSKWNCITRSPSKTSLITTYILSHMMR